MADEPPLYKQLGISGERNRLLSREIQSIASTNEPMGTLIRFMKDSKVPINEDEKYLMVFELEKIAIEKRLLGNFPVLRNILKGH